MWENLLKRRQCLNILQHLQWKRCCHSSTSPAQEVRVRFAPSPTGFLHLGGLRTALYNFLYARHLGGKFLLRIEDTDQTRLIPGASEKLVEDLLWAGIEIDEGPGKFQGEQGPYIQSQRKEIYNKAIKKLLENGSAYRCFCSERRLELLRKEAVRTRQIPKYDNKCRHLKPEEVQQLMARGQEFCIRFKLEEHEDPLEDLIYGRVQHNVSENEGDPVIMKSDQYPTYHFANVVDDHMMGITHVLRGVEWQISTTKHLLLYKAFGWQPPRFGHLPLLVNADGTKLSKRQGDIGIQSFRQRGYFPLSLVNYVVSAGGGFEAKPVAAKPELQTMEQLIDTFRLERVNSHPSRLNPELLNDFNRMEIERNLQEEDKQKGLIQQVHHLVKQTYPDHSNLDLADHHILAVLKWSSQRLAVLQDLTSSNWSFLWVKPATNSQVQNLSNQQIGQLLELLNSIGNYQKEYLNEQLKEFGKKQNIKFPVLMRSLRGALSGLNEGPGVAEMMEILGKTVVIQRLQESWSPQVEEEVGGNKTL